MRLLGTLKSEKAAFSLLGTKIEVLEKVVCLLLNVEQDSRGHLKANSPDTHMQYDRNLMTTLGTAVCMFTKFPSKGIRCLGFS